MMPAVVCNTGPVIALASIDQLELLKSLFREVLSRKLCTRKSSSGELRQPDCPLTVRNRG